MLEGKKALIIGGTSGTGLEIAKLLLKENCSVYITGRHFPEIFTTEKWQDFKNKIHFFHTDFSDAVSGKDSFVHGFLQRSRQKRVL